MKDDIEAQRDIAYSRLADFAHNRIDYYNLHGGGKKPTIDNILAKDVVMFAARGVETSDEFVDEAFRALESSSEETVMGGIWQSIIAAISRDTLDTGDLTTSRDGCLYVCELKSQRDTVNSASFPQELRELKDKVATQKRFSRASGQPVKAAFCVLRDAKSIDETRTYQAAERDMANRDLNGFEYRYMTGKSFWQIVSRKLV
jgi:hypothetical protein